jgi:single-strand DNA-binding protein
MANGINKTTHVGNLTKKPELKYTPKGTAVARLTVACNFRFQDDREEWQDGVDFIPYIAWGRTAEIANEFLDKGSKVYVEGRIKPRQWEKDGEKRYSTDLHVTQLLMLDKKMPSATSTEKEVTQASTEITDDDIPF